MRFYEFEAKRLLGKHGIPVPRSGTAQTSAEAERLATDIGCPVVLKAQVISPAALKAGVARSAESPAQARQAAEELLQIDDGGRKPKGILIEKKLAAVKDYSLAVTYDGIAKRPVMIASGMPGNVDEIAGLHPDRIVKRRSRWCCVRIGAGIVWFFHRRINGGLFFLSLTSRKTFKASVCLIKPSPFAEARLASQDVEIARNPILRGQLNPSKFWRFP